MPDGGRFFVSGPANRDCQRVASMAMGINTADRFYAILQRSALLTEKELTDFRRAHAELDDVAQIMRQMVKQRLLTTWQARKLQAGQHQLHLGKYKLLDRLPWGDSGRVYLAEHTQMHARVALKTLDRRQAADPHALELFRKEGALAAALDHPNLIHVRDFDCENNYYFLVMEYVSGENLAQRVTRDGAFQPEKAADYIAQAAAGLAHAHQEGVLHRTLQPVKLLLTSDGVVKIVDLGASEELVAPDQRLEAQRLPYRAPELLADLSAGDERSDVYSLGALFYLLLNGQAPPPANQLQSGSESQKLKYRAGTPPELAQICQQMMRVDPNERIATAAQVAEQLQAWLTEHQAASSSDKSLVERPVLKTRETTAKPAEQPFSLDVAAAPAAVRTRGAGRPTTRATSADKSAEAAQDEEAAEVVTAWWQDKKILAGAGAGVLIVLLGITVWLFSGSEPPQVAAAPQDNTVTVQKTRRPISRSAAPVKEESKFQFDFPQPDELAAQQEQAAASAESAPAGAEAASPQGEPAAEPAPAEPMPAAEPMAAEPTEPAAAAPASSGPQTPVEFHPVDMFRMSSTSRATFIRLDGERPSYLVGGNVASGASYEIIVSTETKQITGFCLQVLAHDNLPAKGPGLAPNGDFQLARVRLYAGDSTTLVSSDEVKLVRAEASFAAKDKPVANALNEDANKQWSIAPQVGKNHWAVFRLEKPLEMEGKTWLKIELEQADQGAIGRFRILAVTGTAPVKAEQLNEKEDSPAAWNPFNQLAEQITLPAPEAGTASAPVLLGTLAADFDLSPSLLGAETAAARQSFSIQPAGTTGQWNINLHEGKGAADAGVTVAQLVHENGQLSIRWTDQAQNTSEAGYLGNCVLQLEGAGQRRRITMRQAVDAPALEMNFDRPRDNVRVDIPWLPDPAAVHVELIPPESGFPPHEFDPEGRFSAAQGNGWVKFGKEQRLVHCKFTSRTSARGLQLTLEHHLQLDPEMKPVSIARANLPRLEANMQAAFQRINLQASQLGQAIGQAQGEAKTKLEAQKNALEQQIPLAQAALEKVEQLKTLLAELAAVRHIPYRVVYKVDGMIDIELARSQPPAFEN